MAWTIEMKRQLRPCYVATYYSKEQGGSLRAGKHKEKALFHRYVDECGINCAVTYALVEYENGEMDIVNPLCVRFIDHPFLEYAWEEADEEEEYRD